MKKTIEQKINQAKIKQPSKFVWWVLNKLIVKPFLEPPTHPTYHILDDINKCKTGAFVIYNHQSRSDYVWATQCCFPRRMNFVTGYNEFYRKKFSFIFNLIHQIPKKNFNFDFYSIKAITQIIHDNGVVCLAPEGMSSIVGHNQPIVPNTGKFFKHFGVPIYLMHIKGGYLRNHKVCLDDREGVTDVTFKLLFNEDDLKNKSSEELDTIMDKELWEDDYEFAKEVQVKWKTKGRICHHLSDIDYKCPRCGQDLVMHSYDNVIECSNCGNGATMDDCYNFHPFDDKCIIPESPSKWADYERAEIIKEIRKNNNYSFEFDCKVGELPIYKYIKDKNATSILCGEGHFVVDHSGVHFKGIKNNDQFEFALTYEDIYTTCMSVDVTNFALYVDGKYYDFYPDKPCVAKVLFLIEEMHRLHVNKWKNFPWMDYMYKEESK